MNENLLKLYIEEKSFRFKHILSVVNKMKEVVNILKLPETESRELVELAYLHDIGYSEEVVKTGFQPLDGSYFCDKNNTSKEIKQGVMFQTCSFEDVERNFPDLLPYYLDEKKRISKKSELYIDLITYCELHTSLKGERVGLSGKIKEIIDIYGENHNFTLTFISNKKKFESIINKIDKKFINVELPTT